MSTILARVRPEPAVRLVQAIYPDSHDGHNVVHSGYDAAGNVAAA